MNFVKTKINGLYLIEPNLIKDKRGAFRRVFCQKELKSKKINFNIKQTNISENKHKFTLRGFHYQIGKDSEDKIISCISGKIYNVVLDLRKKSKTYTKWISFNLSSQNKLSLLVPKGCANAWLSLKDNTSLLYMHSQFYNPNNEKRIRYNDNYFNIHWPHKPIVISKKDNLVEDYIE